MMVSPAPGPMPTTLTLDEAVARRWDMVIVGAGPAGAATALRLAAAGHAVLIVDRDEFPRGKVCGCCLSSAAIAELDALGIDVRSSAVGGVPLERVRLMVRRRWTPLGMPSGIVLSREALDVTLLRRAIEAGCHWLPHAHVSGCDVVDTEARVAMRAGAGQVATLRARRCVIATGLGDHVRIGVAATDRRRRRVNAAARIGLGAWLPEDAADLGPGELVMAVARHGYCGVVRLEDGRLDLAAAVDRRAVAAVSGPASLVVEVIDESGLGRAMPGLAPALARVPLRATPRLTHDAPLVAGGGRILRVGDAAGYVEPFTGEGIGWAISAARILADTLLDTAAEEVGVRYASRHRRYARPARTRCRGVALAVRVPLAIAAAGSLARFAPPLARRLVPWVVGGVPSVESSR
ncbi:MAG: FAD-dependent oxidoreductase [Planctomycetes bacterium]|nr:FAD-dependent oxidoreductase [Planctomycetota bacterium]MBM4058343.1 FAD-dependent oxidoreductase [Planctomycetota bacterium]